MQTGIVDLLDDSPRQSPIIMELSSDSEQEKTPKQQAAVAEVPTSLALAINILDDSDSEDESARGTLSPPAVKQTDDSRPNNKSLPSTKNAKPPHQGYKPKIRAHKEVGLKTSSNRPNHVRRQEPVDSQRSNTTTLQTSSLQPNHAPILAGVRNDGQQPHTEQPRQEPTPRTFQPQRAVEAKRPEREPPLDQRNPKPPELPHRKPLILTSSPHESSALFNAVSNPPVAPPEYTGTMTPALVSVSATNDSPPPPPPPPPLQFRSFGSPQGGPQKREDSPTTFQRTENFKFIVDLTSDTSEPESDTDIAWEFDIYGTSRPLLPVSPLLARQRKKERAAPKELQPFDPVTDTYTVDVPVLREPEIGIFIDIDYDARHECTVFVGYRSLPDGSKGPLEQADAFEANGDEIWKVGDRSCVGLDKSQVVALIKGSYEQETIRFVMRRRQPASFRRKSKKPPKASLAQAPPSLNDENRACEAPLRRKSRKRPLMALGGRFWQQNIGRAKRRKFAEYDGLIFRDDDPAVSEWRVGMEYMPYPGDAEKDDDLPAYLYAVDSLTEKEKDTKTNRYVHSIWVVSSDEEYLYNFRLFAAQSGIPNSGLGAFIEFVEARKLKKENIERRSEVFDQLAPYESATQEPLAAVLPNGFGVKVTLTGKNLHGNNNRLYGAATRCVLTARFPVDDLAKSKIFSRKEERIRIIGNGLHDVNLYDGYFLDEHGPLTPIGALGMNCFKDYSREPSVTKMATAKACIDLGRYGPFRLADRKPLMMYEWKNFVFSLCPGEWSFQVSEKINGENQMIDITDETTGDPHVLATEELPMYVNEIGHDENLQQNVFICEDDSRVVKYSFSSHVPLKKNEPVELLTNYRTAYEVNRERKGYGQRNLDLGLKPDSCLEAFLQRHIWDRDDIRISLANAKPCQVQAALKHFRTKTWNPLLGEIQQFVVRDKIIQLSSRQWVAVRRLQWLHQIIDEEGKKQTPMVTGLLQLMQGESSVVFTGLIRCMNGELGPIIQDAVKREMMAEIYYEIHYDLPLMMEPQFYCPLATELIERICMSIAGCYSLNNTDVDMRDGQRRLYKEIIDVSLEAKNKLSKAVKKSNFQILQFSSGITSGNFVDGALFEAIGVVRNSNAFFLQHDTLPKGLNVALLRHYAFLDACSLAAIPVCNDGARRLHKVEEQVIMAPSKPFAGNDDLGDLGAVPVEASSCTQVNETWYLLWQIVLIVDACSRRYLEGLEEYSLENLCKALEVDLNLAKFVVARGFRPTDSNNAYCRFIVSANGDNAVDSTQPVRIASKRKFPPTAPRPRNTKSTVAKDASKRRKPAENSAGNRVQPKLFYEGPPTVSFPIPNEDWPPGWIQRTYERMGGASKGHLDNYWHPPGGSKLRSRVEIKRYIERVRGSKQSESL